MSPEASTVRQLAALRADLAPDLGALERLSLRLAQASGPAARSWPAEARAAALAVALHGYYGASEAMLARVARVLDGGTPAGPEWHRELLERLSRPLEGVRPALLSPEPHRMLRRLLGFRHFFRHAYAVDLDAAELDAHAAAVLAGHPALVADVRAFLVHLRAVEESLAGAQ